jgi:hypothetical protein
MDGFQLTKPGLESLITPEELMILAGTDPTVQWLLSNSIPVTRANYLELAFPDVPPSEYDQPLDAEVEAALPEALQIGGTIPSESQPLTSSDSTPQP